MVLYSSLQFAVSRWEKNRGVEIRLEGNLVRRKKKTGSAEGQDWSEFSFGGRSILDNNNS